MSPVSKAKRNYTLKKNALTRLLDPIPTFLSDQSVGKLRLEEARKRCIAAWDALSTAYQELADVQSEDEADDPEQEGRDAEFGNLEGRYHSMVDALAEIVLQRESQQETNRLLNEKTEFVAVRRLHIANLYGEVKDTMTQLRDQLSVEELPSVEQLVAYENKLVSARCVMTEANKESLEVAGLMPDLAKELMDDEAAKKSAYNKMEHEALVKINGFKAQHPQLNPTPAPPAETGAPTSSTKVGAFRFERRSLPKFKGTLREYPTFKKDWISQVSPAYSEEAQLYELRGLVPERVKVDVEKFSSMEQFWEFMDVEFGNKNELVRDRLAYLRDYKHPKDAKTDAQKFEGMYRRFSEVYSDMEKVESLSLLQPPASIQEFMKFLPAPCMEKYIVFRLTELDKGTLDLEIVKRFMQTERKHQKEMQQLDGEETGPSAHQTPNPSRDKTKDQCRNCQKYGHHAKECTKKKPASKSHSGQQVSAQNKEFCPFCKKKGKKEAHEYRPGTSSTRLSSCKLFRDAGAEERAAFVDEIKGCALCLCWKGNHRANNCPATTKGQPFEPCKENGCGKKHHRFLHGTQNTYVNHKSKGKSKHPVNNESSQTSRPESAVMTVGEGRGCGVK